MSVDVEPPQVDPRIVQRRRQVIRSAHRRRNVIIGVVIGVAALIGAAIGTLRSPFLDLDTIKVTGNTTVPLDVIVDAAGISKGDPLVELDPAQIRDSIMALSWVASARVAVEWPDAVRIEVTEERPMVILTTSAANGGGAVLVSKNRTVVQELTPEHLAAQVAAGVSHLEVGSLKGLDAGRPVPTVLADALVVFAQMPDSLRPELVAGAIASDGSLSFALPSGGTVEFGPPEDLPAKLLAAQTGLGGRIERKCLDVLDVREPSRLTIKRRAGCTVPPPTVSATTKKPTTTTTSTPTASTSPPTTTGPTVTTPKSTSSTAPAASRSVPAP